jgi:hypothetical protein
MNRYLVTALVSLTACAVAAVIFINTALLVSPD